MCFDALFGNPNASAEKIAKQQQQDEIDRENRITAGMQSINGAFSGFNDDFYNKRYNDYMGFAEPQIDQQASDARKQLIYALSRTGNLDSSAANDENAQLAQQENQQRVNASNEAQNQENALRGQVEDTRGNLVSELNATGDSTEAANAAMNAVQNLNQPGGFSPLGNLFASFVNTVQQIGSRAGNGYSGFMGGSPVLFAPGGGSSSVVGG